MSKIHEKQQESFTAFPTDSSPMFSLCSGGTVLEVTTYMYQ